MDFDTLKFHAQAIEGKQVKTRHASRSKPWRPSATSATLLGHACERRIVLHRVRPGDAAPIGPELASIFAEGDLHQRDVRRELSDLGFEPVEAEVLFRDDRLEINGAIDCKIEIPDDNGRHGSVRVPVEVKSVTGNAPTDAESWRSAGGLMGRYYDQIQIYLYLTSSPYGLGLFKSKITGLWSVVPVELDYEHIEALLQKAERVRDAVAAWKERGDDALPDRITDRSECNGCPFRETICHPEQAPVDPLLIAQDEVLAAQLLAREEAQPWRDGWEKIDKSVKERFKMTPGDRFVCGAFVIEKKRHGRGVRVDIKRLVENTGTEDGNE